MDRAEMTVAGPFLARGYDVRRTEGGQYAIYGPDGQWVATLAGRESCPTRTMLNGLALLLHRDRYQRTRMITAGAA